MSKKDFSLNQEIVDITLQTSYMKKGDTKESLYLRTCEAVSRGDKELAERLYSYIQKNWFSFSTPILSNAPFSSKALPISCHLTYVPDTVEGLIAHQSEIAQMALSGGGISSYYGDIRTVGSKTSNGAKTLGVIPFVHIENATMLGFQQGGVRRGKSALYIDVNHPEIDEFLKVCESQASQGGDPTRKAIHSYNAINLTDEFMTALKNNETYNLIDPHTKKVVGTRKAIDVWFELLSQRSKNGMPFITFIDTINKKNPIEYGDKKVRSSNLCTEITLHTSDTRSAVCCLSSVNLETYDEWRSDQQFFDDLIKMLDNCLTLFVELAPDALHKSKESILDERALGLGAMGWHSYLQKNLIPFESEDALRLTNSIFYNIQQSAKKASDKILNSDGPCRLSSMAYGGLKRNLFLTAIAPNATSSILCGNVSPSIEPFSSNYFYQKTQRGKFAFLNPHLASLCESKGVTKERLIKDLTKSNGSAQNLPYLTEEEKQVFKTAFEIDQRWIVLQAGERQKYIDQAQSVNLFFNRTELNPDLTDEQQESEFETLHKAHFLAYEQGVKTLYYLRSQALKDAPMFDNIPQKEQVKKVKLPKKKNNQDSSDCFFCEG